MPQHGQEHWLLNILRLSIDIKGHLCNMFALQNSGKNMGAVFAYCKVQRCRYHQLLVLFLFGEISPDIEEERLDCIAGKDDLLKRTDK